MIKESVTLATAVGIGNENAFTIPRKSSGTNDNNNPPNTTVVVFQAFLSLKNFTVASLETC